MAQTQSRNKLKIKKGDEVIVVAGSDKGAKGEVLRVITDERRVVVQGINMRKKHNRPSQANPQGGIETVEAPLHVSNVALADPKTGEASRVGYTKGKDGTKMRFARKSGETLS